MLGAVWVLLACSTPPSAPPAADLGWSHPPAALAGRPGAEAYLRAADAYAALLAGEVAKADRIYDGLHPALAAPHAWPADVSPSAALHALRFTGELAIEAGIDPLPVPCAALRAHPEARAAFGAVWGSTKDVEAASMRERCAGSALLAEKSALQDALEAAAPLPSGTMYQSMELAAWEPVDWLVLQPHGALVTGQEAALREAAVQRTGDHGIYAARDRLVGAAARALEAQGFPREEAQERAAAVVDLVIVTRLSIRE